MLSDIAIAWFWLFISSQRIHALVICAYWYSLQGILRLRGRPAVAYDQQGLVFAVAMEGGAIKLFDSRSYDKVYTYKAQTCWLQL